jgi:carbon-monoxide dehydrogenase large subunit
LEQAVTDVIARGRECLAHVWSVAQETIRFEQGIFFLPSTNRTMSIAELAAAFPGALDGESRGVLTHGSCANGCHACEVEIDPTTGDVRLMSYIAVDDFGRVVNEAAVLGQVQGGIAQGVGQALMEQAVYDRASGQPATGSWLDYAVPRALDVPTVRWIDNGLTSRTNLFGAKACGEAGASVAPPAVMNAIVDALGDYPAADTLQMPARAAEVWRVIHG